MSAQAFETRLLTQMVRLPIPSWQAGSEEIINPEIGCKECTDLQRQHVLNDVRQQILLRKSKHAEPMHLNLNA